MKISPISLGVVLPADVQAMKGGGGRPAQEATPQAEQPDLATHKSAAAETKASLQPIINGDGVGLRFYFDRESGIQVIEVIEVESGEVIRQIPPNEVVSFMRRIEGTKGSFVSRRF